MSGRPGSSSPTPTWSPTGAPGTSSGGLEHLGLTMYGQMTAGSWIYIGTQGILQGTYECFAAIARKRFGGSLAGTLTVTAGLGGMGGAQPLAITMNGGVALCIEVDPERAARRVETRYLDAVAYDYDDALSRCREAVAARRALSVGLVGNAADLLPRLLADGVAADIVTDQTSAHDPLTYIPTTSRSRTPTRYGSRSPISTSSGRVRQWPPMSRQWSVSSTPAPRCSTTETASGPRRRWAATTAPSTTPGFLPAYIRPLFCEGKGPFRWVALSGDPADIAATDRAVLEEFPDDEGLARWITLAGERVAFQGLPARICWLGYGERHRLGLRFNEMVRSGEISAPIVIGRDHLDSGSVASPYRETEDMADGSDAIADWPLLQRPGERVLGSDVGEHPPRWRSRHRPVDPRRPGVPRRRHRLGRGEAGAGPVERPGHRGHATRRRRV